MILILTCFKEHLAIHLFVIVAKLKVLSRTIFFTIVYIPKLGSIQFWHFHVPSILNYTYMLWILYLKVKTAICFTLSKTSLSQVKCSEFTCWSSIAIITVILYIIYICTVGLYRELNLNVYVQRYFYLQC